MQSITVVGIRDAINEELGRYCSDKYANGTVGAANLEWLKEQKFEFIRFETGHYCNTAVFEGTVTDSESFGQFLEALAKLKDYPLFDEDILSELQQGWTDEEWEALLTEHKLDADTFWRVVSEGDYWWEDDGMADNYGMHPNFDIDEFVALVKAESQTWNAHYFSGMGHEPELCQYCTDAKADEEAKNV